MSTSPWGGSEALWSEAALRLVRDGHRVTASVHGWPKEPNPQKVLRKAGIDVRARRLTGVRLRPKPLQSISEPIFRRISRSAFARWLSRQRPDAICISNGGITDQLGLMDLCRRSGIPYSIIVQANAEQWWPDDKHASTLIEIYSKAQRLFFVATRNLCLLENQLGVDLPNAEIVRNPINVSRHIMPPWPKPEEPTRLACVGRLDPDAKGQDLLLQVMASSSWRSRPVTLSFYGGGDSEQGLRRLSERLGIGTQVTFCGHVDDIASVWSTHHALVLPSRYEGTPLTIVEALMCGRPVITTDVAGNAEIVKDGITGFVAESPTVHHLSLAMDKAWAQRESWERMGQQGASDIRRLIPEDPSADFAQRLLNLPVMERPPS
jgi:glycosyltransferase involved in cell wall biosynthesis